MWILMWLTKLQLWENDLLHTSHMYGLSPVCVLMCICKLLKSLYKEFKYKKISKCVTYDYWKPYCKFHRSVPNTLVGSVKFRASPNAFSFSWKTFCKWDISLRGCFCVWRRVLLRIELRLWISVLRVFYCLKFVNKILVK